MKDLKTTIAGLVLGLPIAVDAINQAYQAGVFTGKTILQTIIAAVIIIVLAWAKDRVKPIEIPAITPTTETFNSNQ